MMIAKILFAALLASILSGFQYLFKQKSYGLFVLRFFVYFILFIFLFDFHYTRKQEKILKPDLYILADQSKSIKYTNSDKILKNIIDSISKSELKNKFILHFYGFGKDVYELDSIRFNENQTDIYNAINTLTFLYNHKNKTPLILISDGISTTENMSIPKNILFDVYPVILGDTTHYENLYIDEINYNPVTYQGNKFPVEILVGYEGKKQSYSKVRIIHNNKIIAEKNISFHRPEIKKLEFLLQAEQIGKQNYHILIVPVKNEKNKKDNSKYITIDIIDQKKKILFLYSFIHPDIGLIKRQLKENKYLKIDFKSIQKAPKSLRPYSAIILYQPDANFEKTFPGKTLQKLNWFIITGTKTDWNWLNHKHLFFEKTYTRSIEEYFPYQNKDFDLFTLPMLSLNKYPPLKDLYGSIKKNNISTALFSKIQNIQTEEPLLIFNKEEKQVALLGEGYWQWGIYAYQFGETKNLNQLLQQIIQYISINVDSAPIRAEYKTHYYQGEPIIIKAKILNKNFLPDFKAQPFIIVYNNENKKVLEAPLSLSENFYKINLHDLQYGKYTFEITEKISSKKVYGKFQIIKSDKEEINLRTDKEILDQWAKNTNGESYFPNQIHALIQNLKTKNKYPTRIKYFQKESPLIDFRFLLFLIALLLAFEWLIKKQRGKL